MSAPGLGAVVGSSIITGLRTLSPAKSAAGPVDRDHRFGVGWVLYRESGLTSRLGYSMLHRNNVALHKVSARRAKASISAWFENGPLATKARQLAGDEWTI